MDITALMQPLMMLLTTGVSAALGWVSSKYKATKEKSDGQKAEHAAMKKACIRFMGDQLDRLCDDYEAKQKHEPEDTQAILDAWDIYSGCGGDGARGQRVAELTHIKVE